MPRFQMSCTVKNIGNMTVSAHVGASLVNVRDGTEYYNVADDIKMNFPVGDTWVKRDLNTELGPTGKYDFYFALWEGEKPIGKGIKYAVVMMPGAVEKKKKNIIKLNMSGPFITPSSFVEV